MVILLLLLALLVPRLLLLVLWLTSNYLDVFASALWPLLGFLFLPLTTLAYAFALHAGGGLHGVNLVLVAIAALVDLGALGGGASRRPAPA